MDADHEPSAELRAMLGALTGPAADGELDAGPGVVAAMADAITSAGPTRERRPLAARRSARIAAVAAAGLLTIGGVAAAEPRRLREDRPPAVDAPPPTVARPAPPVMLPISVEPAITPHEAPVVAATPTTAAPTTAPLVEEVVADEVVAEDLVTDVPPVVVVVPEVVCADGNHGETVSSVAQATPPGPGHGPAVAAAAQSDCGIPVVAVEADEGPPPDSPAITAPGRTRSDEGSGNGQGRSFSEPGSGNAGGTPRSEQGAQHSARPINGH